MTVAKYTRERMGAVWTAEYRYACWLRVEIAVAEAWATAGRIPQESMPAIRAATYDVERIAAIEEETQHDVIAFLRAIEERVGPDARWIHFGLTSSDVIDTGLALQLVESVDLLLEALDELADVVREAALRYRSTVMMGRTHNVHAEPITFGFKLAVWYAELRRHRARLEAVRKEVGVAKIGGAVGTHVSVPPEIEAETASSLGLGVEEAATQVVQRDRHGTYVLALALLASTLDKVATELRSLQHTEIGEVEEPFRPGQQGSSAMPHKRNPILNERVSGLARVVRGYAVPALENVVLWHERDISNSSVERVILPDASTLVDYMLGVMTRVVRDMRVDEGRMHENIALSRGLSFSEGVLTALIDTGMERQSAYRLVQRNAMESWQGGRPFREVLNDDPEVTLRLSGSQLDALFSMGQFTRHTDVAFERLGIADPPD